ncbi:MFS 1 domain containing protein [Asbolus verrucosus]|uniref:MFS 1 domain containing protein n=1 Tax=Asbolus verrucosus TaxID=1661398 RepID=A0A482WAQ6_ASBVE|nr:MFS 1 domain containing protein [Asbolus verrucosus]
MAKAAISDKKQETEKKPVKELTLRDMTWKERYKFLIENITVEPMLACYIIPSVFASLATQNLNLEKACRVNLAYSTEVCDALSERNTANYTLEEKAVQQLVASMGVWKTMLQSALPAFLIMFVGSWSDRWGQRKPCMLLPIAGELFTVIGLMFCTFFFYELPMEVAGFIEGLFPALTGGWFTMFMGVFSYIADVTTVEMRTLRIGIVNVFCSLGVPIGLALSGVLYKKIGFYGVFSISAFMYVMALYYGITRFQEAKKVDVPSLENKPCAFIRDFFDVRHLLETFKVAFKEGENNRKKKVMLLMLVVMVVIGPMHGEMNVTYLFTRYRFNWDEVDFSMFSTYSMITNLIGAIVEILNGTSFIAMRSIASKLVPADELGKVNSLFGACEALMPLVYGPMYSATYAATINIMPGAFFILGGILTLPAVIIFGWMYVQHKKDAKRLNSQNNVEAGHKESVLQDVILSTAPKEAQIGSPILNGVSNRKLGVNNPAFEMEK